MAKIKKVEDESAGLVEKIIEAAKTHGEESEPDMEVGDLQGALRAAWTVMSPEQRKAAFEAVREDVESWSTEPPGTF
jgi:hypothetical protein